MIGQELAAQQHGDGCRDQDERHAEGRELEEPEPPPGGFDEGVGDDDVDRAPAEGQQRSGACRVGDRDRKPGGRCPGVVRDKQHHRHRSSGGSIGRDQRCE
ncbi:hypothetical protein MHY85_13070 [Cellulomonas sp. ACRRI]|nr:hypothetical protein [Cellulomonas sp. ACRRI]MCG7286903.1 hypothetical protein [Cellulomonas sp. ACRRI]